MATAPTPPAPAIVKGDLKELRIYPHSTILYWWPVWAFGFLFAALTLLENDRIAIVPSGTVASKDGDNVVLTTPAKRTTRQLEWATQPANKGSEFTSKVSENPGIGVVFCFVVLSVIFITNVPLRGQMAIIGFLAILVIVILMALLNVWDAVFRALGNLQIYINFSGYLLLSLPLFVLWAVIVNIFDRQRYVIFTPGQVRVREEIGDGEKIYDTTGLSAEKQRDDPYRHWVLGLGSGDLVIKTSGASPSTHTFANVLFIGKKLEQIQEMLRDRPTVQG